jgi:hypothetical protein
MYDERTHTKIDLPFDSSYSLVEPDEQLCLSWMPDITRYQNPDYIDDRFIGHNASLLVKRALPMLNS